MGIKMGIWDRINKQRQKMDKAVENKKRNNQIKEAEKAKEHENKERVTGKVVKTFPFSIIKYLGGHPSFTKPASATITIFEKKLVIELSLLFTKEKTMILDLSKITPRVESQRDVSQRITVTRMLILGIFSLAAPKKTVAESNKLTIQYNENGRDYLIILETKNAQKICNEIISAGAKLPVDNSDKSNGDGNDIAQKIKELSLLKDDSILTEKEFNKKKKELLDKI